MEDQRKDSDVLKWYSTLFPYCLDLVNDYAGNEHFIIDGDSLLRQVFGDPRIDFRHGFQLLHAVYAVESFLSNLRRRKMSFHIVFFEEHSDISIPAHSTEQDVNKYKYGRAAIRRHLKGIKTDEDMVYTFANIGDPKFEEYLEAKRPYFAMCHDGADKAVFQSLADAEDDEEEESESEEDEEEDQGDQGEGEDEIGASEKQIKTMVQRFLMKGYNVALINHVEFVDSKIFTDVLESHYHGAHLANGSISAPQAPTEPRPTLPQLPSDLKSERERLAVAAAVRFVEEVKGAPGALPLVAIYLLHTSFLKHVSLQQREFRYTDEAIERCKEFTNIEPFLHQFLAHAAELLEHDEILGDEEKDIHDSVDGRLLLRLLMKQTEITGSIKDDFTRLAQAVSTLSGTTVDLSHVTTGTAASQIEEPELPTAVASLKPTLLPFSNPIFDPYLESIKLSNDVVIASDNDGDPAYNELYHWHNASKPLIATRRKLIRAPVPQATGKGQSDNRQLRRAAGRSRRKDQAYLSQMTRYAQSLSGGVLTPEKIIADPTGTNQKKKLEKERESKKKVPPAKVAKASKADSIKAKNAESKSNKKLSKAEQIKLQNAESKAEKGATALQKLWTGAWRELEKFKDDEAIVTRLDDFLKKVQKAIPSNRDAMATDTHDGLFVEVEARIYKIMVLQNMFAKLCKDEQKERGYPIVAQIFDEARKIMGSQGNTATVKKMLQKVFQGLGIALPQVSNNPSKALPDRRLSFQTKWTGQVEGDLSLGMTSEEFQLYHFGPFMDRNMGSAPDDRVPFEPDAWQRKVLDELDSDNSVFVVAPTSAGKTFISFHAMKKVLRADDSGILVYVAPTKALVNQIAAEVISRFSKDYHHRNAGNTVWAIHTRDYRMNNPEQCQVLVTVPHILSIMLLSPTNAEVWAPRVKRIIFDEIHCIGNAEDGAIWEQLLLLAPCPIIALSATVGNPDEFSTWLQSTQANLGLKLSMIQHPHRYSDLRKFNYLPDPNISYKDFKGLGKLTKFGAIDGTQYIEYIHPISAMVNPHQPMPDDLALEPRDCIVLYNVMKDSQTKEYALSAYLDPKNVFGSSGRVVIKSEVIAWEADLKSVLRSWQGAADSPFMEVVRKLGGGKTLSEKKRLVGVEATAEKISDPTEAKLEDPEQELVGGDSEEKAKLTGDEAYIDLDISRTTYLRDKTLPLLQSLHADNALPAILFSYDRSLCEYLCKHLVNQLKTAETEWRKTDPKWRVTVKQWEDYMAKKAKLGKFKRPKPQEGTSKAEQMREEAENEGSILESFNPEDPSIEFSFADFKKHSKSELENDLADVDYWNVEDAFVQALRRGIGVHHAGMNRRYRQAVEMLFRKGYLRVVIATGTLSLGINMPCKTVVFAGDSVYLTALNYRQAAGRAGRRGFDLLGNVIFHGLTLDKVHRLISSRLPSLMGHFPISTSLVLRLFILLHNSKYSEHAKRSISSLLTQPRLVIGGESFKEQVLHHLRFSIEFLRRQRMLGSTGTPFNFAGITSHLYYIETSAFSFHTLLCSGYIGKICSDVQKSSPQITEDLMLVLAHIFGCVPCKKQSTVKALPPLPEGAREVLEAQNAQTLQMYTDYVTTFAKEYCSTKIDDTLPFSGLQCGGEGIEQLPRSQNVARSAFVALSGHTDKFSSIEDLTSSARSGVWLEGASVPYLPIATKPQNSYLLEFFRHGDLKKMTTEHMIRPGDRWFLLKDFSMVLATIVAGLVCFLRDGPGAYFDPSKLGGEEEGGEMEDNKPEEEEEEEEIVVLNEMGIEVPKDKQKAPEELVKILTAFKTLQTEFEEKFRAVNA